jgi:tight adherence protein B
MAVADGRARSPRFATGARVRARLRDLGRAASEADDALLATRVARSVATLQLPGLDEAAAVEPLLPRIAAVATIAALVVASIAGTSGLRVVVAVGGLAVLVARRTAPTRRAAAAERQLPIVLESVARRLRAGGSLAQALEDAGAHATGDLRRPWQLVVANLPNQGAAGALDRWAGDTEPGSAMRLGAAALGLAAATGGSPARAIDGVAATLRARLALADEVRALASQARASAVVIAASPLVFGVASATTDERTGAFLRTPAGLVLLAAGVGLDGIGWWWMSRLCRGSS